MKNIRLQNMLQHINGLSAVKFKYSTMLCKISLYCDTSENLLHVVNIFVNADVQLRMNIMFFSGH